MAIDGDGDRVIFVDHSGRIVRPEQIGVLLVERRFSRPLVVYDLKCASILPRAAETAGGRAIMQPSGHGFIKTAMTQHGADLGVEVSGHYFFRALGGGDDALFAALVVIGLVAGSGAGLADLAGTHAWPAITPDVRLPFEGDTGAVLKRIAAVCGGRIDRIDGIRATYEDGWALARGSITEPAITLRFEGRDPDCLRRIVAQFLAAAPELHEAVLERLDR